MRKIWPEIIRWQEVGIEAGLISIIKTQGSSLMPVASKMAITPSGDMVGSVSGGCVEGAIVEETREVIKTKKPKRLSYGSATFSEWGIGLACGGTIQVFIESTATHPWQELKPYIQCCLEGSQKSALITLIDGPWTGNKLLVQEDGSIHGDLGLPALNDLAVKTAEDCWVTRQPVVVATVLEDNEHSFFVDLFLPKPKVVIIGAVQIAVSLITISKALDYHTIVIDPRSAFATRKRFPDADELMVEWPADALQKIHLDEYTSIVCLSHDEKIDLSALSTVLTSPVGYIGALGSRVTHTSRLAKLREMGLPEEPLTRIHAPIGLNIGAGNPEEIAVSIMAEMIAVQRGKLGQ